MRFLADWVDTVPDITAHDELLLCDAQTSGGLLGAVPGDIAPSVVHQLRAEGASWAALIGSIEPGEPGRIVVRCSPQLG
jgi:selenide,water dikinase